MDIADSGSKCIAQGLNTTLFRIPKGGVVTEAFRLIRKRTIENVIQGWLRDVLAEPFACHLFCRYRPELFIVGKHELTTDSLSELGCDPLTERIITIGREVFVAIISFDELQQTFLDDERGKPVKIGLKREASINPVRVNDGISLQDREIVSEKLFYHILKIGIF